jgi:hypothetical protein
MPGGFIPVGSALVYLMLTLDAGCSMLVLDAGGSNPSLLAVGRRCNRDVCNQAVARGIQ